MREQKGVWNLPIVIGQTLRSQARIQVQTASAPNRGDRTVRYGRKPGIAGFIGRHIFNRSFRNDVNARVTCQLSRRRLKWREVQPPAPDIVEPLNMAIRTLHLDE